MTINISFLKSILVVTIFIFYYLSDFTLIAKYDQKRASGSARDWKYTLFVWALVIFISIQPILLPGFELFNNIGLIIFGFITSLLGLLLNRWARIHLGHLFIEGEEFQDDHFLVQSGPYSHVRHPIYLSIIIISLGVFLVNSSIFMFLLFIFTIYDFTRAANRDEKILLRNLREYKDYMERTPKFFPKFPRNDSVE